VIGGRYVAKLFTQHEPGLKSGASEEKANASLIAMSPELLELMEEVLLVLDVEGLDTAMSLGLDAWVVNARVVAEKARGEA
jgi:hypothetical protein